MTIMKMLSFPKITELGERAQEWLDGTGGPFCGYFVTISAYRD